jgi:selenium metabolism protein YedF
MSEELLVGDGKNLLMLITSNAFGEGAPDLGEKLLKSFLQMLLEADATPDRIACLNSGIFLTTVGSPVLELLVEFEKRGAEIVSCQTCLDYFDRADKLLIGRPTNMRETAAALLEFKKTIRI